MYGNDFDNGVTQEQIQAVGEKWVNREIDEYYEQEGRMPDEVTLDVNRKSRVAGNEREGRLNLAKIYQPAECEKELFLNTIRASAQKSNNEIELDFNAEHTWDDVLKLLDHAADEDKGINSQKSTEKSREHILDSEKTLRVGLRSRIKHRFQKEKEETQHPDATQEQAGISLAKNISNAARRTYDSVGKNADIFSAWLSLLPAESHYTSVLCGGFKLIIGAAQKISKFRSEIQGFVKRIPTILSDNVPILETFRQSPELHICSSAIYVAILKPLGRIYEWYQQSLWERIFKATMQQNNYQTELANMIKRVDFYSNRFSKLAVTCSYQDLNTIKSTVKMSDRKLDKGFNTIDNKLAHGNNSLALANKQLATLRQSNLKGQEAQAHRDRKIEARLKLLSKENRDARLENRELQKQLQLRQIYHLTLNMIVSDAHPWQRLLQPAHATQGHFSPELEPVVENGADIQEQIGFLWDALNIDSEKDVAAADVSSVLHHGGILSRSSQNICVAFMQSDPLQTWLTSLSSSVLLVNGQMFSSSPGEQRTSPLSFICAKLIDILVPEPGYHSVPGSSNVFAVYWFCGEHTDGAQDYDAHPLGMMNNIVSQLLTQLSSPESGDLELDLEPVSTLTRLPGSRSQTPFCNDSIEDLCQLFVEIVLSLPEGTILFCIIDGISYYEHPESRRDGLYEVISTFTKLATQIQGGCVFKLLATAPVQTHYVRDLFYETEIYDLKQDLPGVTNFTELNFHESLGREAQRIAR